MKRIRLFENFLTIPNNDQDYFLDCIEKGTCREMVYEEFKIYRFSRLFKSDTFNTFERQHDYYNVVQRLKNSNINCYPLFNKVYMDVVFISEKGIEFLRSKVGKVYKIDAGTTVRMSWNRVALPIIQNLCQEKDDHGEPLMFESLEWDIKTLITAYIVKIVGIDILGVEFE